MADGVMNPDQFPDSELPNRNIKQNTDDHIVWKTDEEKQKVMSPGVIDAPYLQGKTQNRPIKAIKSGVGDQDDLLVKKPEKETLSKDFKISARLEGEQQHSINHFPGIDFQYGIHYKGQYYEDDNSQHYKHRVDAYPKKVLKAEITQTDKHPVTRPWVVGVDINGHVRKTTLHYAVEWSGLYQEEEVQGAADLFTYQNGNFIGPGPKTNSWHKEGGSVQNYDNRSHMQGVVAKEFYDWDSYECEYEFQPIRSLKYRPDTAATVPYNGRWYRLPGADGDILGFVFKAKPDNKNFYLFLWEAQDRVMSSWRAKSFNGYNCLTGGVSDYTLDKAEQVYRRYMSSSNQAALGIYTGLSLSTGSNSDITSSQWSKWTRWCNSAGWGKRHYKIYKVTNGVMHEVHVTPRGNNNGWKQNWIDGSGYFPMDYLNSVKIHVEGRRVQIYTKSYKSGHYNSVGFQKAFDFNVASGYEQGSTGIVTFSQSVKMTKIRVSRWLPMNGRVPSSGYSAWSGIGSKKISSSGSSYVDSSARSMARQKSGQSDPEYEVKKVTGLVENKEYGSISASVNRPVVLTSTNPKDAGGIRTITPTRSGTAYITPDHFNQETWLMVIKDIPSLFKETINSFLANNPEIDRIASVVPRVIKPNHKDDDDWDFVNGALYMWNSAPPITQKTKDYAVTVYAYEGLKRVANLWDDFQDSKWATYVLRIIDNPDDPTGFNPDFDKLYIKDKKLYAQTKEWYLGTYDADISDVGTVTNQANVEIDIPPMPEHFISPSTGEEMYHGYTDVDFLLNQLEPTIVKDVWMWFKSNLSRTTKNTQSPLNVLNGKPIIKTNLINDKVVVHCEPRPHYIPWESGKYIGYGKVNGKRPFFSAAHGKADLANVPTNVVYIAPGVNRLSDPIIDVSDDRVKFKINPDKTVTFYSDYEAPYVWKTQWHSQWKDLPLVYTIRSDEQWIRQVSIDFSQEDLGNYDTGSIQVERIHVVPSNPFVNLWAEKAFDNQKKINYNFDVKCDIRYPSVAQIDLNNFFANWKNYNELKNGEGQEADPNSPNEGDWHGPPEAGYPKITNIINQNGLSGWYNPAHASLKDYTYHFKVQEKSGWDNDMYGAMFRFDPKTLNFYSFEWDGGGYTAEGHNGMNIIRNICLDPENYGKHSLHYSKKQIGHNDLKWVPLSEDIHDVSITVQGQQIQVYTDGEKRIDVIDDDPEALLYGAFGPLTLSNPDTYFWDLSLETYETATMTQHFENQLPMPFDANLHPVEQQIVTGLFGYFQSFISNYTNDLSDVSLLYTIQNDKSDVSVYFNRTGKTMSSNQDDIPCGTVTNADGGSSSTYTVYGEIKAETPYPWSPMLHNGYYYFNEKENFLFANPIVEQHNTVHIINVLILYPAALHGDPEGKTNIQHAIENYGNFSQYEKIHAVQDVYENYNKYNADHFDVLTFCPADCNARQDITDDMMNWIRDFYHKDKIIIFTHDTATMSQGTGLSGRFGTLFQEMGFTLNPREYTRATTIRKTVHEEWMDYPYKLPDVMTVTHTHWNWIDGGKGLFSFGNNDNEFWLRNIGNVYYSESGDGTYDCNGEYIQPLSEDEQKIWVNLIMKVAKWRHYDEFDPREPILMSRPKQGAPTIVRANDVLLRKTNFYDGAMKRTLEKTERFHGNGRSKYYLLYQGIDGETLKVFVNDESIEDYIFDADQSSIQFMQQYNDQDVIVVSYHLQKSYTIDENFQVGDDVAKVIVDPNMSINQLNNLEIIYEGTDLTPFYRASEVTLNPILTHNHSGFLRLTEKTDQKPSQLTVIASPDHAVPGDQIIITVRVEDQDGNPVEKVGVVLRKEGADYKNGQTNEAGEIYFYDQIGAAQTVTYRAICDTLQRDVLVYVASQSTSNQNFIELKTSQPSLSIKRKEEATIYLTVRNSDWSVMANQSVSISYLNKQLTVLTNKYGQAAITLNSDGQKAQLVPIKVQATIEGIKIVNEIIIQLVD